MTTEVVVRACYLSRTQFTRRFRAETGYSFTEFQNRCRVEEARLLLSETDWSLKSISKQVGLRDPTYFSHLFLHHLGVTPQAYRQSRKKGQKPAAESDNQV